MTLKKTVTRRKSRRRRLTRRPRRRRSERCLYFTELKSEPTIAAHQCNSRLASHDSTFKCDSYPRFPFLPQHLSIGAIYKLNQIPFKTAMRDTVANEISPLEHPARFTPPSSVEGQLQHGGQADSKD